MSILNVVTHLSQIFGDNDEEPAPKMKFKNCKNIEVHKTTEMKHMAQYSEIV